MVPAESEIVLEGRVLLDEMDEGPFTEYTGYISGRSTRNHFKVSGIMKRSDAILMAVAPNNSAEHLLLSGLPKQARISRAVIDYTHLPNLEDINWPVWATHFACFIKLRENIPGNGLAKQTGTLLLGLDHYVKLVAVLPHGVDLSAPALVLGEIAQRCDFQIGSGVDFLGKVYSHLLDPSSRVPGLSSKMIIDATGPKQGLGSGSLYLAKLVSWLEDGGYPCEGNSALFALTPGKAFSSLSQVLNEKSLSASRLIVLVDDDIDVGDARQVLWALATRLQPLENSLCRDGRLVLDARKGMDWTAERATLPFN